MTPLTSFRCWLIALLGTGIVAGSVGCRKQPVEPESAGASSAARPQFVDVAAESGLDFVHRHGGSGRKLYPETMAGGAAWLDYDGDGDVDLYAVQGAPTPGYEGPPLGGNVLFHNEGHGQFRRLAETGAEDEGYGLGCVAADYDNDGDPDLYVANFGPNVLLRNNGDGTFTDVTADAGVSGGNSYTSDAAFGDYDCDGHLDLFLANYLTYEWGDEEPMRTPGEPLFYLGPPSFPGQASLLYHSNGDGTFTDVTHEAGLDSDLGKGMDALWFHCNDDPWPDLFVTNDEVRDFLYVNNGDGTFVEQATEAGVAFDANGEPTGSMSVCAGDLNGDGALDLFVSTFARENNLLLLNRGDGHFTEATHRAGLATPSLPFVKWGVSLLDYDLDGWQDLFIAHGHTYDNAEELLPGMTYAQPDQLYRNVGAGQFALVSETAGGWFAQKQVSRGVAEADYDGDGDLDLYVAVSNGPGALLRNDTHTDHHWLRLKLIGTKSNRDGFGALVTVEAGGRRQFREAVNGAGIFTGSDNRLTFGVGRVTTVERVTIVWPSGTETRLEALTADREHVIREP